MIDPTEDPRLNFVAVLMRAIEIEMKEARGRLRFFNTGMLRPKWKKGKPKSPDPWVRSGKLSFAVPNELVARQRKPEAKDRDLVLVVHLDRELLEEVLSPIQRPTKNDLIVPGR